MQHCGTDLNLGNLAIKIARHETLTALFHTVHPLPGSGFARKPREGSSRPGSDGDIRSSVARGLGQDKSRPAALRFVPWRRQCSASTVWPSGEADLLRPRHGRPLSRM